MAIIQSLCGFAVRQLVEGTCSTVGISGAGEAVVGFLAQRFTDHSKKLTDALDNANERAWKALEIALAGESFWDRCKVVVASGEDKAFGRQVRAFLDANPLSTHGAEFRDQCLRELRTARNKKLLTGGSLDPEALAQQAGAFARFSDPQAVLVAEWQAVDRMAQELRQAGHPNLGQLLSARPPQGMPLLVVAVRYFFRRQVETDQELFQGLAFAQLERFGQGQDAGFAALDAALTQQGQRLESLLGEIQSVVIETHGAVLDLQDQIEGQSEQVRQIGQAVQKLLEQHQLQRRELRPGDSLSIRNDNERQLVKQVVARYRALPEGARKEVPSLLNAIGKLEVVTGNFDAAQKDFQTVALLEQNDKGQAEAHHNAYLASLEKRDWPGAIQELVKAVKLDAKRFAPFPVGKYQPMRILGAGGFGVAFLCKHKYMDAQVVVKTLALDDLGRDADKVFTEAQVLRQLEHPAIIRISECGYVDPAKKSRPYILMDYFHGLTLEEYVKKHGPLTADDLIAAARQVADGLHAAHSKGILHRDVKPANLLVHKDEKGWRVKVIDFGLALRQKVVQKSTKATTVRQSKTLIGESIAGTVDYAAPEQMGRREGVAPGPYSDVYGWAKTCCYALFQTTQPLMKHWQSVPTPLAELLEKCLDEDPKNRPHGFADVLAALDKLTAGPAQVNSPARPAMEQTFAFNETVEEAPKRRAAAAKPGRSVSRLPMLIGGGLALAAVIGMVFLLTVVLRSKTAAGTLVVQVDQPGAEVYIDGQRYTITRPGDNEPIQVEVQEGMRQLKVVKGGFETFTKEFTVKAGGKETIRVRLEPAAVASNNPKPEPPPDMAPPSTDIKPKLPPENALAEITNSIGMKLKLIPAGKFLMGSPKDEPGRGDGEGPQHEVEITRPFYMGVYPVTRGQFAEFVKDARYKTEAEADGKGGLGFNMATASWEQKPEYTWRNPGFTQGNDHPVVEVSWNDAEAFCDWLSNKEGKTYTLPTEAEWEYACRAGTTTRFWSGDDDASLEGNANIADESLKGMVGAEQRKKWVFATWNDGYPFTSPAGHFKPNPWGLYDMAGNVWQWCADGYGPYETGYIKDPQGKDSGVRRVLRGSSWLHESPQECRSAARGASTDPARRISDNGFRVVLRPDTAAGASNDAKPGQPAQKMPTEITNSIEMKLKLIQPGKFLMGSPKDEQGRDDKEGPQHEVEITRPFYMGTYPVTRGQFAEFVKDGGYKTEAETDGKGGRSISLDTSEWVQEPEYNWRNTGFAQTDGHPVTNVSWHDAVEFCSWLSRKEGKLYQLPTEAEWEYACRAGTTTRYWCGDDDASLQGNANIADSSFKRQLQMQGWKNRVFQPWGDGYPFTSPVGKFHANPWGLYDMGGNVWQWCADRHGQYKEGYVKDPNDQNSISLPICRILRGGAWDCSPWSCRPANRSYDLPSNSNIIYGFRIVLRPAAPTP